jgi:hypothetical protein
MVLRLNDDGSTPTDNPFYAAAYPLIVGGSNKGVSNDAYD